MAKPKVLFIHLGRSSFVKEDLRILNEIADVKEFYFNPRKFSSSIVTGASLIWNFIRQFFWLAKNFGNTYGIYCWFSDYHGVLPALFAKTFNKPMITILGGFDCIKMPHLDYGIFCSRWRTPLGTYVVNNSTLLLPVNDSLIHTKKIAKHWPDAHPNGLVANIPSFNTPYRDLPTGYDADVWEAGKIKREKIVSTVAACSTIQIAKRKGLDLFIQTSVLLPDYTFYIVGVSDELKAELIKHYTPGTNLKFLPRQKREDLNKVYTKSSVYLQLSRAEGLPNVLCEAMMCSCVPVGSSVFGIPHGIGDTGYVAERPDPEHIAELVTTAHQQADQLRKKARRRVIDHFSLERRKNTLTKLLSEFGLG